ncbi:MAG: hydrogenase small subunit [Candidatus Desulfofervidaceae bacterium]|nr:hydrogenase small subunit [Candidatus Desulfofervidaceae bacterium]MDL1970595.1 hydrogenase small subunit [Candidatus Desulfofervidaceae bacterium]
MSLSRRDFLKLCGGTAAGISFSQMLVPEVVEALEKAAAGKPPVLWLQGAGCSGCSVSLLNTAHPKIADVLLKIIDLRYHPTIMAAAGELALGAIEETSAAKGKFIIALEGGIPVGADGRYCVIGEKEGKEITIMSALLEAAPKAMAVLAIGTCAAYGGIQAAKPNPTQAVGAQEFFKMKGIKTPVINIPGCPAHPDWIVGTIAHVLLYGIPKLDDLGRPTLFYGSCVHDHCPYRGFYDDETFCKDFNDKEGCRYQLGCKGPDAYCDAWKRGWNGGVNWCVRSATCIACVEPNFWDTESPFYSNE